MPRELRPRKTRQRYTDLSIDEGKDDDEPGPSQPQSTVQEDRGGDSDFAPPAPEEIAPSDDGTDSQGAGPTSGPFKSTGKSKAKGKGKATGKGKDKAKSATLVPAAPARQAHALPNPNVHHRHRPIPLFRLAAATPDSAAALRVERLLRAPRLFAPNELVPTLPYASSPALTRRVGKAWGASVGAGPVWPVVEDLGWFRESTIRAEEEEEARREFSCDFGPFGAQTNVKLETLRAQKLYCAYKYYLAVAPFPSRTHSPGVGVKVTRPSRACIQLWSLGPSPGVEESDDDKGEMRCEMVLCIDSGPAFELKWCPLPSHDPLSGPSPNPPRKLGLLAGVFEDGSLSVYLVKAPEPILRIEHDEAAFCTLDWGNSELIAAGLANGAIVVYNIGRAVRSPSEPILPMGYFCVHQSAVRALTWVRVPDRHGNGPTDIRDPGGHVFNRTRDAINSITYSPYLSAVSYSVSPSTLGRGHALMDPSGPVWDVSASDYHPQLAVGSADGMCYVPFLVHRVYQLDYSRIADRYRMLDRLKPREMAERPEGGGGAWPASVGVQRVAWHCGAGLAWVPYERVEADEPEDNDDSS
ncbi:hypothetical protein H4582DRAFT_1904141 [Lactarius indigo]|nr:hypothetical protein H4582DRAFT_1904141 [Lactarius indigo]